jgi:hypothetical protein
MSVVAATTAIPSSTQNRCRDLLILAIAVLLPVALQRRNDDRGGVPKVEGVTEEIGADDADDERIHPGVSGSPSEQPAQASTPKRRMSDMAGLPRPPYTRLGSRPPQQACHIPQAIMSPSQGDVNRFPPSCPVRFDHLQIGQAPRAGSVGRGPARDRPVTSRIREAEFLWTRKRRRPTRTPKIAARSRHRTPAARRCRPSVAIGDRDDAGGQVLAAAGSVTL